ncbi:MAG: pantoate--beta-alanine ligase [Ignavibacteria bacterium]|nr:pantoate--beta-alanine ligase [Ignavibacteria bacterium]
MAVQVISTISEMQSISEKLRLNGKSIGVVPTMGYLHEGHARLIKAAVLENDIVIVTIFVNPLQFAANEDLSSYPRNFKRDIEVVNDMGGTIVFAPSVEEMYPEGFDTTIKTGNISLKFEGVFRPTHFDGVATVVMKLFMATKPHSAYFGQKDYQQVTVLRQLIRDLRIDVFIRVLDTVRETDGLAKSSRNVYLSTVEREKATILSKALTLAIKAALQGERRRDTLNEIMKNELKSFEDIHIDYASAACAETLEEPPLFAPEGEIVFLVAVRLGKTRLIDNMVYRPGTSPEFLL